MLAALVLLVGVLVAVLGARCIERMAQGGERIYRARHRDHSKVPPIK